MPSTPSPEKASPLHPYCKVCGWRKGGVNSWDGEACKCGHREPPMPQRGMEAIEAAVAAAREEGGTDA